MGKNISAKLAEKPWYRWLVAVLIALMNFIVIALASNSKGLFLVAITDALGIKRSIFSFADSVRCITTAVVGLFFGKLISRFGERKLLVAACFSLVAFSLCFRSAESMPLFLIGSVFQGVGLAWTNSTMSGYVIGRWFPEKRGTVLGAAMCASGLGTAFASQVLTPIINDDAAGGFGYRNAYTLIAVLMAILGVTMLLLIRKSPDVRPIAGEKKKNTWQGPEFSEILRKPYFYITCVLHFLTGISVIILSTVNTAHFLDVGLGSTFAAAVLSVYALVLAASKALVGISCDRLGIRCTHAICGTLGVIAAVLLAYTTDSASGRVMAYIHAVTLAIAMPLDTVLVVLSASELFGERASAKVLGIFVGVMTAGFALSHPIANTYFDLVGNYRGIFLVTAGLLAVVTVGMQFCLLAARKLRAGNAETKPV